MLKTQVKAKRPLINLRVEPEILKAIKEKAEKYAAGNMSEWLRYAALNHEPNPKDLVAPQAE